MHKNKVLEKIVSYKKIAVQDTNLLSETNGRSLLLAVSKSDVICRTKTVLYPKLSPGDITFDSSLFNTETIKS